MSTAIVKIPLSQLVESPFNPRKHYDEEKLKELAASLKVTQEVPIKVREVDGKYEIVFGHRRHRAAKLAKLEGLDAVVVKMSDDAALLAQIVENGQREDVTPLEEADSYAMMRTKFNKSVDDIADTIGKSKGHVYARLKLTALKEPGRKALITGKIMPETALLIARIPTEKMQAMATKEIVDGNDPMTFRQAAEHIQRRYMLLLAEAPFDKKAKDLLPAETLKVLGGTGPSCVECQFRTGNMPAELRADVKGADICTSPECFRAKVDADAQEKLDEAKERGQTVLSATKSKEVFSGRFVVPNSGYIDLDAPYASDPKRRTLGQILGKDAPPLTVARDADGFLHNLADAEEAHKALKATGYGKPTPAEEKAKADQKKDAAKERDEKKVREQVIQGILGAAGDRAGAVKEKDLLRVALREQPWNTVSIVAQRHDTDFKGWRAFIDGKSADALRVLLVECLVEAHFHGYKRDGEAAGLKPVLDILGFGDLKDLEKEAKSALKEQAEAAEAAKEEAKAAKKTTPAAKGPLARKIASKG
jgi:ParB/RepB/Spo0J family partition protein